MLLLIGKLHRLKARLRIWNAQVFRNIYEEIDQATLDLNNIQHVIATTGYSDEHFDTEMNFLARLNDILSWRHAINSKKSSTMVKEWGQELCFFSSPT